MCGIVGYIGSKPARGIIINGLKRLNTALRLGRNGSCERGDKDLPLQGQG
jgi:hypothetical protein